jgi:hypothetical protein
MGDGKLRDAAKFNPEETILATLRTTADDLSLPEVLERLELLGLRDHALIKATIQRLLAMGKIHLSPDRRLSSTGATSRTA